MNMASVNVIERNPRDKSTISLFWWSIETICYKVLFIKKHHIQ